MKCTVCGTNRGKIGASTLCMRCAKYRWESMQPKMKESTDFAISIVIYFTYILYLLSAFILIPYSISDGSLKDFIYVLLESTPIAMVVTIVLSLILDVVFLYRYIQQKREINSIYNRRISLKALDSEYSKLNGGIKVSEFEVEEVDFNSIIDEPVEYTKADAEVVEAFYRDYMLEEDSSESSIVDVPIVEEPIVLTKKDIKEASKRRVLERKQREKEAKIKRKNFNTRFLVNIATYTIAITLIGAVGYSIIYELKNMRVGINTKDLATTEFIIPKFTYGDESFGIFSSEVECEENYTVEGAMLLSVGKDEVVLDYSMLQPNQAFVEFVESDAVYMQEVSGVPSVSTVEYKNKDKIGYYIEYSDAYFIVRKYIFIHEGYDIKIFEVHLRKTDEVVEYNEVFESYLEKYSF